MKNKTTPPKVEDKRQTELFRKGAMTFDPANGRARQEFKKDADVNVILRRHQGGDLPQNGRQPIYGGTIDYDVNLQEGLAAVDRAQRAFSRIHPDIRARYKTWDSVSAALAEGKLQVKGGRIRFADPPKPPLPEPAKPAENAPKPDKPAKD